MDGARLAHFLQTICRIGFLWAHSPVRRMRVMKRLFTMTCLAATFAVGLAAQSTIDHRNDDDLRPRRPADSAAAGRARSRAACAPATPRARYMLTDVHDAGRRRTPPRDATATSTAARFDRRHDRRRPPGRPPVRVRRRHAHELTLTSAADVDLKAHVGHKIEVTGTMAGGRGAAAGATRRARPLARRRVRQPARRATRPPAAPARRGGRDDGPGRRTRSAHPRR